MAMQWQNIEIMLSGIDQYTDAPWVVNGKLEIAENCRFRKPPTIAKRTGFEDLGDSTMDGSTPELAVAVTDSGYELLSMGDRKLYAYANTNSVWQERGTISDFHFKRQPLFFDQSRQIVGASLAQSGFCMVSAWGGAASTVQGVILDLQSDSVVNTVSFSTIGGVKLSACRPVAVGTNIVIILSDGTSAVLYYAVLDTTANDWSFGSSYTAITLTHAPNSSAIFDVCPLPGTDDFLIAYKSNAGDGNHPIVVRCNLTAGAVTESVVYASGSVLDDVIAVCGTDGERVYAAWNTTLPSTQYVVLDDAALTVVSGPGNLEGATAGQRIGLCRLDGTHAMVTWEMPTAGATHAYLKYNTITQAGALGTAQTMPDWQPATKPFMCSGACFTFVYYESVTQPTFALVEISNRAKALQTPRWAGTAFRGSAHRDDHLLPVPVAVKMLPDVIDNPAVVGNVLETVLAQRFRVRNAGYGDVTVIKSDAGTSRLTLDAGTTKRHVSAPWGSGRFIAGARPSFYDANAAYEHGFATYPERIEMGTAGAGALNWSVVFVYEYLDALGNIMRSAPSPVFSIENLSILPSLTNRETLLNQHGSLSGFTGVYSSVRVIPYRTTENPSAQPFVYYRASDHGFSATAAATHNLHDEYPVDADLIKNELLYTDSDVLDNVGTPSCTFCHVHNGRLWLGGTDDPSLAWFSQPFVATEQPRFNEALTLEIGTDITGFASMDETLIAFGQASAYVLVGDGPPATGGLDIGFEVATISTDVGCIEPKSIIQLPTGVMFLSSKGIYHISRKLEVTWAGAPVKPYTDQHPTCVGATLLRNTPEVVFAMVRLNSGAVRLVYNYIEDKWSVDTGSAEYTGLCSAYIGGSWTLVYSNTAGDYRAERGPGAAFDTEPLAPLRLRTPQLKLNTLQGWQRIRSLNVMARSNTGHGLTVKVDYDNEQTFAEVHAWTTAEIAALPRYQLKVPCNRQKCQSVQWEILETTDDPEHDYSGSSVEIISLVAEGGFMPGKFKRMDPQLHTK